MFTLRSFGKVGVEAYAAYELRAWLARDQVDQRPDPAVRQVVGDLLLHTRHGRAGRLPPDGPGRDGTGAVADHHHRVLPAGPGPRHGDRAGAHAAGRRRDRGYAGQPDRTTSHPAVPSWSSEDQDGPGRRGPGADRPVRAAGPERSRARTTTRPWDHRTWPAACGTTAGSGPRDRREAGRDGEAGVTASVRSGGVTGSNEALNALARMISAELTGC